MYLTFTFTFLKAVKKKSNERQMYLYIHITNSKTMSFFGNLWEGMSFLILLNWRALGIQTP